MKYLLKKKQLQKKYEDEVENIISGQKYRIQKIESFAEFADKLHPFHECAVMLNSTVYPISFSECESGCKLLGTDALSFHKTNYDNAKYIWAKKQCTDTDITKEENFNMLKEIQNATLPFGCFSIAFKCHRLHDKTIKSHYDKRQINFSPLLYDFIDVTENVSDFFCEKLANEMGDADNGFHQMNVYTDNILTLHDVDEIYPLIKSLTQKYNEYSTTLYHLYKDSEIYRHREDFPL